MSSLKDFLKNHSASELITKDFKLVQATKKTTILNGLKLMIQNKISALPIYDEETKTYVGFAGILDLMVMIVTMAGMKEIISIFTEKHREVPMWEFIAQEKKIFNEESLAGLANLSEKQAWNPVTEDSTLLEIATIFANKKHVRAIPITSKDGSLKGVISPLRLAEFLIQNNKEITPSALSASFFSCFDKSSWSPENVKVIKEGEIALEGFIRMTESRVSGLPVVDSEGKLIGCLSASDLKGSQEENFFPDLYLPVQNYLDKNTPQFLRESSWSPIKASEADTIQSVLERVSSKKIHRLFVTNQSGVPIHVISLNEVIQGLLAL